MSRDCLPEGMAALALSLDRKNSRHKCREEVIVHYSPELRHAPLNFFAKFKLHHFISCCAPRQMPVDERLQESILPQALRLNEVSSANVPINPEFGNALNIDPRRWRLIMGTLPCLVSIPPPRTILNFAEVPHLLLRAAAVEQIYC